MKVATKPNTMSNMADIDRILGHSIISKYLTRPKNILILEAHIFQSSSSSGEYFKRIYECVGYLTHNWVTEYHEDIKQNLTGFDLSVFHLESERERETDKFLTEETEVEEGALTCPRCNTNKTFSYTKQVRSADEGTSVFARCYNCSNLWRES